MIFKASVIMPIMRLHEDIRPPAAQILALTGPDPRLLAMYPGPQPFLFYLGKNVVEISSVRQIPPGVPWLLIPAQRLTDPGMPDRLARYGFRTEVLSVPDDDQTSYTLLSRTPAP